MDTPRKYEVIDFFGHGWLAKDLYDEAGIDSAEPSPVSQDLNMSWLTKKNISGTKSIQNLLPLLPMLPGC